MHPLRPSSADVGRDVWEAFRRVYSTSTDNPLGITGVADWDQLSQDWREAFVSAIEMTVGRVLEDLITLMDKQLVNPPSPPPPDPEPIRRQIMLCYCCGQQTIYNKSLMCDDCRRI